MPLVRRSDLNEQRWTCKKMSSNKTASQDHVKFYAGRPHRRSLETRYETSPSPLRHTRACPGGNQIAPSPPESHRRSEQKTFCCCESHRDPGQKTFVKMSPHPATLSCVPDLPTVPFKNKGTPPSPNNPVNKKPHTTEYNQIPPDIKTTSSCPCRWRRGRSSRSCATACP